MLEMAWRPDKEIPSLDCREIAGSPLHIDDDDNNDHGDDDNDDDDKYDDHDSDDIPPDNMESVVGMKGAVGCALKVCFLRNWSSAFFS